MVELRRVDAEYGTTADGQKTGHTNYEQIGTTSISQVEFKSESCVGASECSWY